MRIQYCSDLHLEFELHNRYFQEHPIKAVGDILILAGDITYWKKDYLRNSFFDYVADHFKNVYYIPGNHEFYAGNPDLKILDNPIFESIRSNVHLVNNTSIIEENTELFLTSLWSHIPDANAPFVEVNVSDYHYIKRDGKKITSQDTNELHQKAVNFLDINLANSTAKHKVVVTHHVPTQICNHPQYKDSLINSAFVSEQKPLIEKHAIDYWIYGHHHAHIPPQKIGKTTLLTNQLGYVKMNEKTNFDETANFII